MNFQSTSVSAFLEKEMKIDLNGVSEWFNVAELNDLVIRKGFRPIVGNGSPVFQNDRGMGKKYEIEKQWNDRGALEYVRTTGFCSFFKQHRGIRISAEVRKTLSGLPCALCGSSHHLQIDHKDGRKNPDKKSVPKEFQVLCRHCNGLKRERCKKCSKANLRFDATTIGYQKAVAIGSIKFKAASEGCRGCYMHDPIAFRNSF